jgi:hypothetical protein
MNMYVLYLIGPFIETVFGRMRYLLIYFITGLAGSIVSVWIHPMAVGAGASGAIFGLYGAVFGFFADKAAVAQSGRDEEHWQVGGNLHPIQRRLRFHKRNDRPFRPPERLARRISSRNGAGAAAAYRLVTRTRRAATSMRALSPLSVSIKARLGNVLRSEVVNRRSQGDRSADTRRHFGTNPNLDERIGDLSQIQNRAWRHGGWLPTNA